MRKITTWFSVEQGLSDTFPRRFFSRVDYTDSCWFWTGYRMPNGYGLISKGGRQHGALMMLAHRASWILHFGPIPEGKCVLHDCPGGDCRWCVNPAHLWLGRAQENSDDKIQKRRYRAATPCGELNGHHKLTLEEVETIRRNYVWRYGEIQKLAIQHGVAWQTIWNILHHKVWKSGNCIKPIGLTKRGCSTRS